MRRIILLIAGLSLAALPGFAVVIKFIEAPRDNGTIHETLSKRDDLKPFAGELWDMVENRVVPLGIERIEKIFGPKLVEPPKDLVLPILAPDSVLLDGTGPPELYAIGHLGYIEFYYDRSPRGNNIMQWVWYHRADSKFVPLKSADDFAKRLEWDKTKLAEIKQWLDQHLPKFKDLGRVEISTAAPSRVALDTGKVCLIVSSIYIPPNSTNFFYHANITDGSTGINARHIKTIRAPLAFSNTVVGFSVDDDLYNVTLKPVEPPFTELGVVELAEGIPHDLTLSNGQTCSITARSRVEGGMAVNFQSDSGNIPNTWVSKSGGSVCFTTGGAVFKLTPVLKVKAKE